MIRLPVRDVAQLLDGHAMTGSAIAQYPFSSNVRRRYEDLDRFPTGLVVIGDTIASVDPIYGQGMSMTALDAVQLHLTLAERDEPFDRRFFERAASIVDDASYGAVGSAFRFRQTTGPKPVVQISSSGTKAIEPESTDGRSIGRGVQPRRHDGTPSHFAVSSNHCVARPQIWLVSNERCPVNDDRAKNRSDSRLDRISVTFTNRSFRKRMNLKLEPAFIQTVKTFQTTVRLRR